MTDRAPSEVETVARNKPLRVATEDQPAALAMWDAWDRYHSAALDAVRGRSRDERVTDEAGLCICSRNGWSCYVCNPGGQSRDDTVCRAFSSNPHEVCMTYEQWERMSGRSRDETVRLAEVVEWLCGPDSFVPTDGTAAATRRRVADALLARFGAGRAEDER